MDTDTSGGRNDDTDNNRVGIWNGGVYLRLSRHRPKAPLVALTTKLSDHWPTVTLGGNENMEQPETIEAEKRASGSLERVVGTPGEYCETVEEALAAGWLKPYEGGLAADGWKGRIYGRRPGNHRIFRCTRRPNK